MTNTKDIDLNAVAKQMPANIRPYASEVAQLAEAEKQLAELKKKYTGKTPDGDTKEGYEKIKKAVNELTKLRTGNDRARLAITKPHRDMTAYVNKRVAALISEVETIEQPYREAKQQVDERERRQKEERIARLRSKIQDMESYIDRARGRDSADIAEMIEAVDAIDTQADFYELTDEAVRAQADTLEKLGAMYSDRLQYEQAEKARQEAEARARAQEQEQRITDRLNALRMMPMDMMESPADEIRAKLGTLKKYAPPADEFGERLQEAQEAQEKVIEQVQAILTQAEKLEEAKAAESRRMDENLKRDMAATTPGMTQEEAERTAGTGADADMENTRPGAANSIPDGELDKAMSSEGAQNRGMNTPPGAANAGMGGTQQWTEESKTEPAPGCEVPRHYGVDMASGPDQTVETTIPAEDKADIGQLRGEHQGRLDAFNEAVDDIWDAGAGIDHDAAEMILEAIIAGKVRYVTASRDLTE